MDAPPPPPNNNGNKPNRPAMKLKLTTGPPKQPSQPPPTPPVQTPGGTKLKLKIGGSSSNTPVAEQAPAFPSAPSAQAQQPPKPKRKYTKKPKDPAAEGSAAGAAPKPIKKRKAEGEGDTTASPKKPKPTTLKIKQEKGHAAPQSALQRKPSLSIKIKNKPTPTTIPRIKVKHVGQPPPRPAGVGYDSEAEDIEIDPAIEHQMILRMLPGPDCDYLRKAIEERRLGVPVKDGGADIQFRFFDREGRRACITVQGNHYAASLVDLPCVIEGMKSWEKKAGWFKSADICQMLLVLGKVDNEDAAKDFQLPREVEKDTWQYPHGLTPPMHYVRKRRFRKRVSYRTIEAVEEEVERLLELDNKAKETGGVTEYEIVDLHRQRDGSSVMGEEDGAYEQELIDDQAMDDGGFELDEATMARLMEQELGGDDHEEHASEIVKSVEGAMSANDIDAAHAVVSHALGQETTPAAETPGGPSAAETEQSESESDEGDDDDVDEAAMAAQQEAAQQREEIADLQREVENARLQMEKQSNPLLKNRLAAKFKSLQSDLELKKASLGDEWDDGLFEPRMRIRALRQLMAEAEEKAQGQGNLLLKTRLRAQCEELRRELAVREEELRAGLVLLEERVKREKVGVEVEEVEKGEEKPPGTEGRRDSLLA